MCAAWTGDLQIMQAHMTHVLVIGGASSDILHIPDRTVSSPGGAGMYTAMAARQCGARASLFAPRPDPMTEVLAPVLARLDNWLGPWVPPDELPHFEIAQEGERSIYLTARFGSEGELVPEQLPSDLSGYDIVHVVPLGNLQRQLDFVRTCRRRGARKISAGTFLSGIQAHPAAARAIIEQSDLFFMNEAEAIAVFGSTDAAITRAGKLLFVTLGERGALALQGEHRTLVAAPPTRVIDPTGAGDAFCGAVLAYLARGQHPVMAARRAASLASQAIEKVGPAALLADAAPPDIALDARVCLNPAQIDAAARLIGELAEAAPFDFTGPEFPDVAHPHAPTFFVTAVLQQFGFWQERAGRYSHPMIATIGGASLKGAFYLFRAYLLQLERDPRFFDPAHQAAVQADDLRAVFRADDGADPMPAFDLHLAQARSFGNDLTALGLTAEALLERARASAQPLGALIAQLDHIGGYKEDPLRKKSSLLALALSQRPERFLTFAPGETVEPVIDYHLMRSCLRIGLIDVLDQALRDKLIARHLISPAEEWAVRYAGYRAIEQLVALSGRDLGAVDWFFFGARKRCPEMSEPDCAACPVDPHCAHHKSLFQPALRTTFY